MKILNLKLLLFFVVSSFFFTSCNNSDNIDLSEPILTEETNIFVEADNISDEVNNVIDDFFVEESLGARSEDNNTGGVLGLGCMTRAVVIEGTTKTVTLDFGEGCELPNGTVLSGKIILIHAVDTDVKSLTIKYTFENFYFNELNIEGENTVVRVRENENGNPQSTLTINMKITWPDGEFASRRGTKIREWIEGYNTRTFGDNVFLITGNWTTTFKNGTLLSATIIEPLRREMACRFIVSGVVELQKNDRNGFLNFGDGSCDNKAIFTNEEGEEFEIILRGKMF
ncbi:hypothetical protein Lupro_11180 [Lutibacter profundi]|uniref:Lipoprotein n=1 Tax=Lutibacter profundi TaxID=1622118 RepID=A0A0X8G8W0_9FLAO|nr:hypothetical protein [Lutibacter profundi]AMC11798.1 hypothetical protein Lupro_11180 [Lutibacter profundi]